ncbi:MAG: Murein hydrolase activator EnvC [Candidatus Celerinatantimonas neptuna]|nr:MAG: Murein hydrolase activator EnvC [Candidatus Celerinatantimonas neptuna]
MTYFFFRLFKLISVSLFAGTFLFNYAKADDVSPAQLHAVIKELNKTHHATAQAKALLTRLQQQLRHDELSISRQRRAISNTVSKVTATQQQLRKLKGKAQTLQVQQKQQQGLLKKQVEAAYVMGKGSYLKMLLKQRESSHLEQMLGYYHYLNLARLNEITSLKETDKKIKSNQQRQQQQLTSLTQLLNQQKLHQKKLAVQMAKRRLTVKQTNLLLSNNQLKTQQLNDARQYLKRQLTHQVLANIRLGGLSHHSLNWPVKGKIIHDYRTYQFGGTRWDGVVIKAPQGTPVKAVANGQVVFADWLRGYGLVIVLNHGKHYMTLYGFNQTLLHKVGDKVLKGETIATVGNTGGRPQYSLFFQIRYRSSVENPHRFIR